MSDLKERAHEAAGEILQQSLVIGLAAALINREVLGVDELAIQIRACADKMVELVIDGIRHRAREEWGEDDLADEIVEECVTQLHLNVDKLVSGVIDGLKA